MNTSRCLHAVVRRVALVGVALGALTGCSPAAAGMVSSAVRPPALSTCTTYPTYLVPDDPSADMAVGSGQPTALPVLPPAADQPRIDAARAIAVVLSSAHPQGTLVGARRVAYSSPGSGPMRFGDRRGSWIVADGDSVWIVVYTSTVTERACGLHFQSPHRPA